MNPLFGPFTGFAGLDPFGGINLNIPSSSRPIRRISMRIWKDFGGACGKNVWTGWFSLARTRCVGQLSPISATIIAREIIRVLRTVWLRLAGKWANRGWRSLHGRHAVDPWPFLNIVSGIQNGDKIFQADFHWTVSVSSEKNEMDSFCISQKK